MKKNHYNEWLGQVAKTRIVRDISPVFIKFLGKKDNNVWLSQVAKTGIVRGISPFCSIFSGQRT